MENGAPSYPYTSIWSHAHLRFTLQTNDPAVACRAEEIFGYWPLTECPGRIENLTFTVCKTAHGWSFSGCKLTGPVLYDDIRSAIRAAETATALTILTCHKDFLTIHGALMAKVNDAVLIVGPSESGKSTTACALWDVGWQLMADDLAIIYSENATAAPLLRRISLRNSSRALVGEELWQKLIGGVTSDSTPDGYVFHPDEFEGQQRARPVQLKQILFLKRRGASDPGPAQVSPLTGAQALVSLAPYTNVARYAGMGEAMTRLGPLLNHVPCHDLGRGPLSAMVKTIQGLLCQEVDLEPV